MARLGVAAERANMTLGMPPSWAERMLRLVVRYDQVANVSGDLLEAYRETIEPARGRRAADRWYVWQVSQFVWLAARPWSILFSTLFIARAAFDWFTPPEDFATRAALTTWLALLIMLTTSLCAAVRCRSVVAGVVSAFSVAVLAAPISVIGMMILLGLGHDPVTLEAIRHSGGLAEALTLSVLIPIPATAVGAIAGLASAGASRLWSRAR